MYILYILPRNSNLEQAGLNLKNYSVWIKAIKMDGDMALNKKNKIILLFLSSLLKLWCNLLLLKLNHIYDTLLH